MRIGLVGFGRWGRHILRDLVDLGTAVTVVDRSGRGRSDAVEAGAAAVVASVAELEDVDGVVVATPTHTHGPVVESVLNRVEGPVYVEKPLTDDPATARRIVDGAGDRVFVMEKWRYHPGIEAIRDLAAGGSLGRLRGIRSVRHQWGSNHTDADGVWILVPHDLSIAREILGTVPEPRAASGFRVGTEAALVALLGGEPWLALDISTLSPTHHRELHVLGDEAVAVLPDSYADHVEVRRPGTLEPESVAVSTELPLLRELRAFVAYLDGGPPPKSTAAEGAEVVERIVALRRMAGIEGG
ncbi:MAG TPA: Gfo/Idh/MocA family oxidoreductase [Actinomycetota bacterium]|nr:Gfo/Idh/MocA family oxidoreductase [Actinomycetota bacterium]